MTIEFVAFSDFHAHNFSFGATKTTYPVHEDVFAGALFNSRFVDSINVLREIYSYRKENHIDTVLFGGDLFHSRQAVKMNIFNMMFAELRIQQKYYAGSKMIMIPGNHDYADRHGHVHSLSVFDQIEGVEVKDDACGFTQKEGWAVVTVPYTDDKQEAIRRLNLAAEEANAYHLTHPDSPVVLLAHVGIQGAKVGADYVLVSDHDVTVEDIPQDAFDLCLFGHYHQHQRVFKNGWYIGATHAHNWGDAGKSRGFVHVTFDGRKPTVKFIETEKAPRFIKTADPESTEIRPQDFVKFQVPSDIKTVESNSIRSSIDSAYFEFEFTQAEEVKEELILPTDTLHPDKMIEFWVKDQTGEEDETLTKIGQQLLAEAEGTIL